jgi:hypothetical protein
MATHPEGNTRRPGPRRYMLPGVDPRTQAYRDEVCQRYPGAASVVSAAPAATHCAARPAGAAVTAPPATPERPARPRRIRVTNHFDVIAQDMPQARPFLDLQMGECDRLALHQVLACHLEQWHRYLPITAAADSRSARVAQGQSARPHGPSAGGHGIDSVLPVRARVRSDLNSGREARVVSPSQRGSEHA